MYSRLGHVGQKWYWNTYLHHVAFIDIYMGHSTEKGNFLSGDLGVRYLGFVGICEHIYLCQ